MESIIVWYLRMGLFYFVVSAMIGVHMLVWPETSGYFIRVHAHLNLLGFMSMMIYGIGYHILPKFSGVPVYSPKIVKIQFWLGNAGLIGMAISWPLDSNPFFRLTLVISALLSLLAVALFAFNILKTIKPIESK
ncbi:MAG: hypothetical protein HY752_02235 [Nitrospirae bacterium]|nr:hypothetical protein [Nitrospirota bacterium]